MTEQERQRPIEDYALIGDCHGAALVSSAGSIDWCTPLRFDADPIFFGLLDADSGGRWSVEPKGVIRISRGYIKRTNILRTQFETETGTLELIDFMPVGRTRTAKVHDYVTLNAPGWVVRRMRCTSGHVDLTVRFCPRGSAFSTEPLDLELKDGRIDCANGTTLWCDGEAQLEQDGASVRVVLQNGEIQTSVMTSVPPLMDPRDQSDLLYDVTHAYWTEWCEYSRYIGPYHDVVLRSALALKLLTYAPTGAIVAAPTTSLPEKIGGQRNWDYRFCWVRDATFALFSLSVLGYSAEASRFSDFLSRFCLREGSTLRIMYGIDGKPFLDEKCLSHLSGYRDSRPVRVGNEAADQRQLDIFGELLDWADLRAALGSRLNADDRALMCAVADHVCKTWQIPDHGIWEMRTEPRHFTQGKAMAWVTLDRAIRLFGDKPHWRENRDLILQEMIDKGCTGNPPHLVQSYGAKTMDAALLQIPLLGLPLSPELLERTVKEVERELRADDLVDRYRGTDGLDGDEGAFFITSFWLVEALLLVGRAEEASDLFEQLLSRANDVGLYAEEVDRKTGAFLGNFPQAFTHLSLISSASLLQLYHNKGAGALKGTNADRATRIVGATEGFKALVFSLIRNRKIRLKSSRKSVLSLTPTDSRGTG
ncbi:glycoside hydrolase family 15 protein [Loktanella sp. SALINAS62]|uniref:glycoside hydrolase family 15 protein n=1 Tax=Loktanella sp. SALINAS62 TaxID=2706124 RepID=UPI001B8A98FF|nr:glycoside hydrolase family 15 protein [Loktanella sp. SALINAS62]MBS1302942.1 glycoside hydrolase family 15 protein [Loktanella sp. SALINAS62]